MDGATVIAGMMNVGAVGVVLAWHLFQINPRLDRIERSLNRLVRSQMITVLGQTESTDIAKNYARELLAEIDGAKH